jgi:hypothetical protein
VSPTGGRKLGRRRLLRAALLAPEFSVPAWRELRRVTRLDDLVAEESRLAPLLLHNLPAGELADDADRERIRGCARHAWARNQGHFRAFEVASGALTGAGVEPLLVKGLSLALSDYPDAAARAVADVDLFVPEERVPAAVRTLSAAGWAAALLPSPGLLANRHALTLRDEAGRIVRLHWHALMERMDEKLDEALFGCDLREVRCGRVDARVPGATAQFFHTCARAVVSPAVHRLQWAADAWHTLRARGDGVDFDRVERLALDHGLVVPVREALLFLADALDAPIPRPLIERLLGAQVAPSEARARRRLRLFEPLLTPLPLLWYAWRSRCARRAPGAPAVGFPRYLCMAFDLGRPAALIPFLAGAGRRRLAHRFGA